MPLIDKNELIDWIENWIYKYRNYHPYAKGNDIPISELYDILERMPTVQPQQTCEYWDSESKFCALCRPSASTVDAVKHGEWIEDAGTYYRSLIERGLGVDEYTPYFTDDIACSACLAKYSVLDNETDFFKYCPNCGAKMDGKEQDDE